MCFLEEEGVLEGGVHRKCLPSYCLGGKESEKMTVEGLTLFMNCYACFPQKK